MCIRDRVKIGRHSEPVQDAARPVHRNPPAFFIRDLSCYLLPEHPASSRIASTQSQCLFASRFTMTLEKPASVRKVTNWLRLNIFIPSMTESHLLSRGFSPSTSLTIRKMPPGRKMRYTSRKLSVGPGQKYTVSKAVARSNALSSKGRRETSPCMTRQRPACSSS